MRNVDNVINTFYEYVGSKFWMFLLLISVVYIFIQKDKKTRKVILIVMITSILCIYNDVMRTIIGKVVGTATYYRFFWLVPVTMICAYALVLFLSQNYKMICKLLVCAGIAIGLIMGGDSFWSSYTNQIPENKYLMPNDVWEISELIQKDKTEKVPTIAMPEQLMFSYISYDADAVMGIGREAYLYFSNNNFEGDPNRYPEERILAKIVNRNEAQDILKTKAAIYKRRIDYLVVDNQAGLENFMESIDCTLVGGTENYELYRVNYNMYEKVTDTEKIAKIEAEMGISADKESINIEGVEKEYKILVANDLHDFALDDTVSEEKYQVIYDRYNTLFRSATGVHSLDLWNGLSVILDSYDADSIIFIGDMVDYSSPTNLKLLQNGLKNIETPYIYLRADHDLGMWYAKEPLPDVAVERTLDVAEYKDVFVKDCGEFYLVGWNNSTSQLTEGGLETMKKVFTEGKPIVLATHVPLDSIVDDSLYKAAKEADSQGRAKLWGERCLYKPDNTTQEFLDMVYAEDSPVEAVLAGHLHFKYTVKLTDNITEYVMPPAFSGKITMVTVE